MNIASFFIKRPVFAGVLSILILIVGGISLFQLPISEYPEIIPPSVVVRATYPGANAETQSQTVATPLEQAINGVENAMYMSSQSTSDGTTTLTVTFRLGTDIDMAQVQVQNRVSQALPRLPEEVRSLGVTTTKQSPDLTMVAHLVSPNDRYDEIFLRNYATLHVIDEIARIPGVGSVLAFGSGDFAMRVWLDPDKLTARGMVAADVVDAIREQNRQVAAGGIGQAPLPNAPDFEVQLTAQGRLVDEAQFGAIIVKTGTEGQKTFLRDVARIELGAASYSLRSLLDNRAAVALPIFQSPGANAIQLSDDVRAKLAELKTHFPEGLDYSIVYDPTVFVRQSIHAVVETLLEAIFLVVIVVILFLQTWRASIIPLCSVPVSLIGTFAAMHAFGFSINALSLFGLVLAIGIVVDDAIVVVENVERNISLGLSPIDATKQAMKEVTGPIVATALVLCAVFIPTAFISGLTGQFYKQFAITIAISTVISAFNSLTLSPALSALLLRAHDAPKDLLTRVIDTLFGWFFRPFNRAFAWAGDKYSRSVNRAIRLSVLMLVLYVGLIGLTSWIFKRTPTGFVPTQDKQYAVAFAQLPDASSIERTDAVIRRMSEIALKHPGVAHSVAFPGLSINGFANSSNAGIIFIGLDPFEERTTPELSGMAIVQDLNREFSSITEAFVLAVPPPAVNGMGALGGFKMFIEDRGDLGSDGLYKATQGLVAKAWQDPNLANVFSTFTVNVPQLRADIDREKARSQGIRLSEVFETLQINLGSLYVNDFNRFGRTYQVVVQADGPFRDEASDIANLRVRSAAGAMVPLGSIVKIEEAYGPDRVQRYNGAPAAEITGGPAPGHSSGESEKLMAAIAAENLPPGASFEWTDLTYQRILAGNTALYIYPLCILLVFLVLAAQYESFRMPLAIIMIVPLCLLFALVGVWFTHGDNNVFTQIGLIVLVGLACKNAILIVEFAKVKQDEGLNPADAAVAAARLRLRPILMTSLAFIAGVSPLVSSHGAGSEMRHAMGVAVFSGMIGVTLLGLILTPVFYATLLRIGYRRAANESEPNPAPPAGHLPVSTIAGALALALFLTGCLTKPVGPDYQRPPVEVPDDFSASGPWKAGEPAELEPRGEWWEAFGDPVLSDLERRAGEKNHDLEAAAARVAQARAGTREARSRLNPATYVGAQVSRTHYSQNTTFQNPFTESTNIRVPVDVSWELDLFGGTRRTIEAVERSGEAQLAYLETTRLALHAEVASLYFALRAADDELAALLRTNQLRAQALTIAQARFDAGAGTDLDLARAQVEEATTREESAQVELRRTQFSNALAVLLGEQASTFKLAPSAQLVGEPPAIPPGLPSALLERRPDVAAAERDLAARNALIGVARAAYFPSIHLTGFAGYESRELKSFFDWNSLVWSILPSVSMPLFQGNHLDANLERARANYDEGVALYRQQLLIAFREVEDSLAATRLLSDAATAQQAALDSARRSAALSRQRYDAGFVGYLDVVDSERTVLAIERASIQIRSERFANAVQFIKALGGGWSAEGELPALAQR